MLLTADVQAFLCGGDVTRRARLDLARIAHSRDIPSAPMRLPTFRRRDGLDGGAASSLKAARLPWPRSSGNGNRAALGTLVEGLSLIAACPVKVHDRPAAAKDRVAANGGRFEQKPGAELDWLWTSLREICTIRRISVALLRRETAVVSNSRIVGRQSRSCLRLAGSVGRRALDWIICEPDRQHA